MRSEQVIHTILGLAVFASIGSGIFFYENFSDAAVTEVEDVNVSFSNSAPVILSHDIDRDGVPVADGATLTPNVGPSTTPVAITGQIQDVNGETPSVEAVFYRSGVGDFCSLAGAYSSCKRELCSTSPTGDPTIFDYSCDSLFRHYFDPTTTAQSPTEDYTAENWIVKVIADDLTAAPVSDSSSNFEMGAVTGLSIQTVIDLGFAALSVATVEKATSTTNYGNVRIDTTISAANDFVCTGGGTIPRGHLRFSDTSGAYGAKTTLTSGVQTLSNIDIPFTPDVGEDESRNIYWQLLTDAAVGGGVCTLNTIQVTAVAG